MLRSGLIATTLIVLLASAAVGAEPALTAPDKMKWMPADGLPPGAQVTVLYGDPTKAGPFVVRFKFPAGYEIALHSHSADEMLTVVSGNGRMAFGQNADVKTA